MKKLFTCFTILFINFTFLMAQKTASEYLNVMGTEFKAIQSATWDYTKTTANNKSARKVDKKRTQLVEQINASIKKVSKMPSFNNSSYFKDSVTSFLKMQKIVLLEDYAKIMDLEDVAESSYDAMEAYLKAREIANDKLGASSDMVNATYKKFAEENNVTLLAGDADKVTKRLQIAKEVYAYYNEVYLIFFKSFKQEVYLLDALNRADIGALEQNRSSLSAVSKEALGKLKKIKPFMLNDKSLLTTANEINKFYKEEADLKFAILINYYTKKEAFDKAQKAFESKKKKTNDDINAYNKLIAEYNQASQDFNSTNEELNKKRSKLLNQWNKTATSFTAKYL